MQRNFKNSWIFSGIFSAALISIGAGYILQARDQQSNSASPSATGGNMATESNFSLGPGQISSRSSLPEVRPEAKSMFALDRNGNLLIDESTEPVLDSLLVKLPPNPTALQIQNLEAAARVGLPDNAAAKVAILMHSYINYRNADAALPAPPEAEDLGATKNALDKKMALRRRYFDRATVEGLFGVQEAQKLYTLEIMEAVSNNMLSAAEKAQRIKALHQALPPKVAAIETNGAEFSAELEEQVATLRLRDVSDEDISHLRKQYFGAEDVKPTVEKDAQK